MAETLGSLIDKLSIKSIREFHIRKMVESDNSRFSTENLNKKLDILSKQKKALLEEIEEYVIRAQQENRVLKDEKLKLYNKASQVGQIGDIPTVSKGIDALTQKNFELWQLEDEARREDVPMSYVGEVKRKIDAANQQRNDLMDKVDELLEKKIAQIQAV